mmetsp:Transcript_40850/g.123698  ORF Transcript_40850/g.123698 Transcript_40850/m.123698 type:complete len:221 (-) Transcript_40850:297-959(-)
MQRAHPQRRRLRLISRRRLQRDGRVGEAPVPPVAAASLKPSHQRVWEGPRQRRRRVTKQGTLRRRRLCGLRPHLLLDFVKGAGAQVHGRSRLALREHDTFAALRLSFALPANRPAVGLVHRVRRVIYGGRRPQVRARAPRSLCVVVANGARALCGADRRGRQQRVDRLELRGLGVEDWVAVADGVRVAVGAQDAREAGLGVAHELEHWHRRLEQLRAVVG